MARTLTLQNQIRSTTSGIEYDDALNLAFAETLVNESFLSDPTQVSGTMVMDLNYLRTAVRDLKGESPAYNWYDPAGSTAGLITLSGARGSLNNLITFVGSAGDLDSTPDYANTNYITQNGSLETAISELDAALLVISGSISNAVEIQKQALIRTGGQLSANSSLVITAPGAGWTSSGDAIVIPSSTVFMESIEVFVNGVLQLNGVNSAANNDVYYVAADTIAFEYKIRNNDVIQILKFPVTP